MNEKSNYIVLVIAVVVVFGAFYFYRGKEAVISVPNNQNATSTSNSSPQTTEYKNSEFGFKVSLPKSWSDFEVILDNWEGYSLVDNGQNQKLTEVGPLIYIRHPSWTEDDPRQDIPVMVFTHKQWSDLNDDKFHIGAAPVGPSELARNANYVFALPARYNYAFPTGYEEVQTIIDAKSVKSL